MLDVKASISALNREFETITHNLANVSTVGYKRRSNAFSKTLETNGEYSAGNEDLSSMFDFSQGSTVETGRPLDLALFGKGFFTIETPDGPLYTRNGMFSRNQNGQVVDSIGRIVAGQSGPITIPGTVGTSQLYVAGDGTISAGSTTLGKLRLVDFEGNENKLVPTGDSSYRMPDKTIIPVAAQHMVIKQGYQEASNVKIIEELVDMIFVTRLYEANVKSITAQQEASSTLMSAAMG